MFIKKGVPGITNLVTKPTLNANKGKIPGIANLATTAAITTDENKIPNDCNLVKTDYNTKLNEIEKKIADHDHSNKYMTIPEFN